MITAVIVEDEKIAQEILTDYIKRYCPSIQLSGVASNIHEAVPMIHELKPDIVFLDVEMPFGNGFDVLDACSDVSFETIFITAYAEYAIKAINKAAAYYLLKPVSIEELILAVEKVKTNLDKKQHINRNKILLENLHEKKQELHQLVLPTIEGFDVVKTENVIRLQGNGNFTDIFLHGKQKKMVCRFLKYFEELLPEHFVRIHKSHIINTKSIVSYHKGSGGYVTLDDGSEVEVSATFKDSLLKLLVK